ncbi:MAG: hypothetical protein IT581_10970 [Verrucomicrobiales bacterium]|nr:hypothetical protein [Verrucomicrobiales bacterium]
MSPTSPPKLRVLCRLVVALVTVVSWCGCVARHPSGRDAASSGGRRESPGELRQASEMTLDEAVDAALRSQPDNEAAVSALRVALQGREYPFFAEMMARAAREPRDREEISRWLRISAEWVGTGRKPADLLSFARELSHRECCTRANYVGAAIEGWVAGLSAGGRAPASDEIETRWRLRELSGHADPRIAGPARAALSFFPGDDSRSDTTRSLPEAAGVPARDRR